MNIGRFATRMDRFGIFVFVYVIVYSLLALRERLEIMSFVLLFIGIGGLCVDSFVVWKSRKTIRRDKKW